MNGARHQKYQLEQISERTALNAAAILCLLTVRFWRNTKHSDDKTLYHYRNYLTTADWKATLR